MTAKGFPDISEHQGIIDWDLLAPSLEGVILRCGYGDNVESQDDRQFVRNALECERLEIPYGVYLYSYATTESQAESEASHALRLLDGRELSYPVFFDSEEYATRFFAYDASNIFCERMQAAGYDAGIYASESWWKSYLDPNCEWLKWVANWSVEPRMPYDVWQYTDKGHLPGYGGRLDLNRVLIDPKGDIDMTDEQIEKLAQAIADKTWQNFNEAYTGCDDNKPIWGPEGKGSGDGKRNFYNTIRWIYDMFDKLNKKLDRISKNG